MACRATRCTGSEFGRWRDGGLECASWYLSPPPTTYVQLKKNPSSMNINETVLENQLNKSGKRNPYQILRHARMERERKARRRSDNRPIVRSSFARGCILCRYVGPDLDHHHRYGCEKKFEVANGTSRSTAALLREIEKCVVMCRGAHRDHHIVELDLTNGGAE